MFHHQLLDFLAEATYKFMRERIFHITFAFLDDISLCMDGGLLNGIYGRASGTRAFKVALDTPFACVSMAGFPINFWWRWLMIWHDQSNPQTEEKQGRGIIKVVWTTGSYSV